MVSFCWSLKQGQTHSWFQEEYHLPITQRRTIEQRTNSNLLPELGSLEFLFLVKGSTHYHLPESETHQTFSALLFLSPEISLSLPQASSPCLLSIPHICSSPFSHVMPWFGMPYFLAWVTHYNSHPKVPLPPDLSPSMLQHNFLNPNLMLLH